MRAVEGLLEGECRRRREFPEADFALLSLVEELCKRHREVHRCVPGVCKVQTPLMNLARRWKLVGQ